MSEHISLGYFPLSANSVIIVDPYFESNNMKINNIIKGLWNVYILIDYEKGKNIELVLTLKDSNSMRINMYNDNKHKWIYLDKVYLSRNIMGVFDINFYEEESNRYDIWSNMMTFHEKVSACKFDDGIVSIMSKDYGFYNIYVERKKEQIIGIKIISSGTTVN